MKKKDLNQTVIERKEKRKKKKNLNHTGMPPPPRGLADVDKQELRQNKIKL